MEVDLPVWTIRPNWRNGITERLQWLTDVIMSDTGVEQRRSLRPTPRRSFEFTVNPRDRERTYLDLVMHRLGSETWLVPLWHDQAKLAEPAVVEAQALMIDNTFREFQDGGYALLFQDTFTWEVVEIQSQGDLALILANDVERDWPAGTKVYPLRQMRLSADSAIAALTSRVGEAQLLWTVTEANPFDDSLPPMAPALDGHPMILVEPNRSRSIDTSHTRLSYDLDSEVGLTHRVDTVGRAFGVQGHNWMVKGREAQHTFRRFLYYLRGRQRMAWLPSFNRDLVFSRPVAAGATAADIEKVGLSYIGAPIPGRARIWTGEEVLLHANMQAAQSDSEERVGLTTPTTKAYAPGAWGSFLEAVRLDTDTLELQHHTDSDGVFECSATFKAFANDRQALAPFAQPKPAGNVTPIACGVVPQDNPCLRLFGGWYTRYFILADYECQPEWGVGRVMNGPDFNFDTGVSEGAEDFIGTIGQPDYMLRAKVFNVPGRPFNQNFMIETYVPHNPGKVYARFQYNFNFCRDREKDYRFRLWVQQWFEPQPTPIGDIKVQGHLIPYDWEWDVP